MVSNDNGEGIIHGQRRRRRQFAPQLASFEQSFTFRIIGKIFIQVFRFLI